MDSVKFHGWFDGQQHLAMELWFNWLKVWYPLCQFGISIRKTEQRTEGAQWNPTNIWCCCRSVNYQSRPSIKTPFKQNSTSTLFVDGSSCFHCFILDTAQPCFQVAMRIAHMSSLDSLLALHLLVSSLRFTWRWTNSQNPILNTIWVRKMS